MVPNAGESNLVAVAGDCKDESFIRKVDTMNESYILREKGAVLNWFDITEVEGCYSLNDTVGDIMKSQQGQALFANMMQAFGGGENSMIKPENMGQMMKMMEGFTVLRLMKLMGAANVTVTKEQMLGLNAQLNQIKKVD
jgi:beta-galactosidase